MESRRWRRAGDVGEEDFRASSNTPVRLLAEAEYDAQARVIEDLRHELEVVKAREQRLVESYERRIRELEAIHKADVALLLEESTRTNSALLCIRGLCDFQQTTDREESPCADDLLAAVLSDVGCSDKVGGCEDAPLDGACGRDVDQGSERSERSERSDEPTVVHEVVGDGVDGVDGERTEDGDVASLSDGFDSVDSLSDRSVIFSRQDDDLFVKDSFCPIRDFRGENPGVLTENNMDRILDHPASTYQGNTACSSRSPTVRGADIKERKICSQGQVRAEALESPSAWKIPSVHTRTRLLVEELEKKLKMRRAALESSHDGDTADKPGTAVNTADSVDGERPQDEKLDLRERQPGLETEDEFVRTIKALGDSSPTTANLLTQHVCDSWVQKYVTKASFASGDVPAGKSSGTSTRSSFLKRTPISLNEVFSSSSPLWATRLT